MALTIDDLRLFSIQLNDDRYSGLILGFLVLKEQVTSLLGDHRYPRFIYSAAARRLSGLSWSSTTSTTFPDIHIGNRIHYNRALKCDDAVI